MGGNGATDADLWGAGARRWLRYVRIWVRDGRPPARCAHSLIRKRFATHWPTLELETWQPLMAQARTHQAEVWGKDMDDWRHAFLAIALEIAYRWAFDLETAPARSRDLRSAVAELRGINRDIVDLAERMAGLLGRSYELREGFALGVEWTDSGPDLWSLLERVAQRFPGTCLDPRAGLATFLCYVRGTSRPTPNLADLMSALAACEPGEPFADEEDAAEALRKTKGAEPGAWSERVRQLLATLDDPMRQWDDDSGRVVSMLDCFGPQSLATLARVAAGFHPFDQYPPGLELTAIERALRRFRSDRARGDRVTTE